MKIVVNGEITEVGSGIPVEPINQAEYNALPADQKNADVLYVIPDADAGSAGAGGSNEVYSTEETRIGTWIDGKPLYRRVYANLVSAAVAGKWVKISDPPDDLDTMVAIFYTIIAVDNVNHYAMSVDGQYVVAYNEITKEIVNAAYDNNHTNCPVIFWIEYTKTTD